MSYNTGVKRPVPPNVKITRSLRIHILYVYYKVPAPSETLHERPLIHPLPPKFHPLPPKVARSLRISDGAGYFDVRRDRAFNACAIGLLIILSGLYLLVISTVYHYI